MQKINHPHLQQIYNFTEIVLQLVLIYHQKDCLLFPLMHLHCSLLTTQVRVHTPTLQRLLHKPAERTITAMPTVLQLAL